LVPGPYVALKCAKSEQIEAVQPKLAVMTVTDMPDEQTLAGVIGRRLSKFAGARYVATADVEPVTGEVPSRNAIRHNVNSIPPG